MSELEELEAEAERFHEVRRALLGQLRRLDRLRAGKVRELELARERYEQTVSKLRARGGDQ